jgi:hypothetical protein
MLAPGEVVDGVEKLANPTAEEIPEEDAGEEGPLGIEGHITSY